MNMSKETLVTLKAVLEQQLADLNNELHIACKAIIDAPISTIGNFKVKNDGMVFEHIDHHDVTFDANYDYETRQIDAITRLSWAGWSYTNTTENDYIEAEKYLRATLEKIELMKSGKALAVAKQVFEMSAKTVKPIRMKLDEKEQEIKNINNEIKKLDDVVILVEAKKWFTENLGKQIETVRGIYCSSKQKYDAHNFTCIEINKKGLYEVYSCGRTYKLTDDELIYFHKMTTCYVLFNTSINDEEIDQYVERYFKVKNNAIDIAKERIELTPEAFYEMVKANNGRFIK